MPFNDPTCFRLAHRLTAAITWPAASRLFLAAYPATTPRRRCVPTQGRRPTGPSLSLGVCGKAVMALWQWSDFDLARRRQLTPMRVRPTDPCRVANAALRPWPGRPIAAINSVARRSSLDAAASAPYTTPHR